MESAWRDARISRIYEGTNEINRMVTIGMLIKKAFKGHVNLIEKAEEVANELTDVPTFDTPELVNIFDQGKNCSKKPKKSFFNACGCWNEKIWNGFGKEQEVLLAISDVFN